MKCVVHCEDLQSHLVVSSRDYGSLQHPTVQSWERDGKLLRVNRSPLEYLFLSIKGTGKLYF